MDTKTLRTEISQILETLNEQWEMIQQNQGHIPQIELDLFQSTIRDLYESLSSLHRKNDEILQVSPPPVNEPVQVSSSAVAIEPKIPEPEPEPEPEPVAEVVDPPFIAEIPVIPSEPVVQPAPVIETPQPQIKVPPDLNEFSFRPPKPEPDLFSGSGSTISDKLKDEKITLNEKLQQDNIANTVSEKLHQNPIKDLKSSIGINEKFQFINELFNGSLQDYTLGITELNQFPNYEEALKMIDVLKFKFNWDINSDAYHKIMDFVRRRYM